MRTHPWLLGACLAAAWISQSPGRAHACSCPPPAPFGFLWSKPSRSATGVVRNQPIELGGDLDPETIELLNARGEPQPFERRSYRATEPCEREIFGYYRVELIPEPILEANATYEIRAEWRSGASPGHGAPPIAIQFSTSDDVLPDPELETPEGRLTLLKGGETSCGLMPAFGCLEVDDPTDVEVVMRDGDTILQVLTLTEASTDLSVWRQMPTCIDVQRRAPSGRRSKPLSWCGSEIELSESRSDVRFRPACEALQERRSASRDEDEGPSKDPEAKDDAPERSSPGCTTLPGARNASLWTGFLLLALLGRRARRAR